MKLIIVIGDVTTSDALSVHTPPVLSPVKRAAKSIIPTDGQTEVTPVNVPADKGATTAKVIFASSVALEQPVVVVMLLMVIV